MATLYIDSGNTRLKWRYRAQAGAVGQSEVGSTPWGRIRPTRVVVAAVRRSELLSDLLAGFQRKRAPIVWAKTRRRQAGLQCLYEDPSRLGVDRWLAAIAGWHASNRSACVVVDCGTAVTVEVVFGGQYQGGYIVPGRPLMADALGRYTERVQVEVQASCATVDPGRSTEESVNRGLIAMLVGLIERSVRSAERSAGVSPSVVLCGGGAPALVEHLDLPDVHLVDNLVLDGLVLAYPK